MKREFDIIDFLLGVILGVFIMTGIYLIFPIDNETCPQGYTCERIIEPEFAGSAYIQNGCVIWNGSEGYNIIFKSVNGTQIPRCDEVEGARRR